MMDAYVGQWFVAFLLTQMIEVGVYTNLLPVSRPLRERLTIAFGASAVTHPLVWFVIPALMGGARFALELSIDSTTWWWYTVAVSELFAFGAEALWLIGFGLGARRAVLGSLAANGASFTVGLFCYQLMGW